MSSSKRRSITKKITLDLSNDPSEFRTLLGPVNPSVGKCIQDIYFGEKITHTDAKVHAEIEPSSSSSTVLNESINDGEIDSVTWSKSSGSSTSGSENLEAETAKNVRHEYDKIEDFLYEEGPSLDKEYEQWRHSFVHLRIIGKAVIIHPLNAEGTKQNDSEETITEHYDQNQQFLNNSKNTTNIRNKIREAVINIVLKDVHTKLLNKHRESYSFSPFTEITKKGLRISQNTSLKSIDPNITRSYNETYLQVSSIPLHNSLNCTKYNYQSPIMRSHVSASKWQREHSDYSSLPHIMQPNVPYSSNANKKISPVTNSRCNNINSYSATSRKKSNTSIAITNKKMSSPETKNITLPPIKNLKLFVGGDCCKSVSPTLRKFNTVTPVKSFRK